MRTNLQWNEPTRATGCEPHATGTPTATAGPAAGATVPAMIGGKYRVVRTLGSGGAGTVYEAVNTWTGRAVAVKVLRPEHAGSDDLSRRFAQEAQHAVRIAHPNIVDVLDMARDPADGSLYVVQELLAGEDLRRRLVAAGPLSLGEALAVAVPVMDALGAAHARGIVHRDLKPENIFLARDAAGRVVPKLIDFGIAKVVARGDEPGARLSPPGGPIGTPHYMSPEQVRADARIDPRADVWSLGVVLYEALAGRCPFEAPSLSQLLARITAGAPPRLDHVAPSVPRAVADVVHRALEPDRERRFGTMGAFHDALVAAALEPPPRDPSGPRASRSSVHAAASRDFTGLLSTLASVAVVGLVSLVAVRAHWLELGTPASAAARTTAPVAARGRATIAPVPAPAVTPIRSQRTPTPSPRDVAEAAPTHAPPPEARALTTTPRATAHRAAHRPRRRIPVE